ncbi:sulfurtransferase complex subunit TusD [Aliikangiella sp. IMCC44632]
MSKPISLLVTGSPNHSQAHLSALEYCKAVKASQHKIESVFFYQDAVLVANQLGLKPTDETNLLQCWKEDSQQQGYELQVCVAASNRRGVISQEEAQTNQLNCHNLDPQFKVVGLGQLAALMANDTHTLVHFK